LHHLCHRLIHFDIPWSLMVFQQRNGRIDRYGQTVKPDIRYMYIESRNRKIKGDMRIIEILFEKEKSSVENIGDPASIMKVFTKEGEEDIVMNVIESGSHEEDINLILTGDSDEYDPLDELLGQANAESVAAVSSSVAVTERTLYTDREYVTKGFEYINSDIPSPVEEYHGAININVTEEMERRLRIMIPEEAYPEDRPLCVSDDKRICMDSMARSMQNSMDERAWPAVQYLWAQHPIVSWLNDKAGLLFKRDEAPVIGFEGGDRKGETIFIVSGTIPNEKSTPVVDEWFGLRYKDGVFAGRMTMDEVVAYTKLGSRDVYNTGAIGEAETEKARSLLPDVVGRAREKMNESYKKYREDMDPRIDEYVKNLEALEDAHLSARNEKLMERMKELEKERKRIEELFDRYVGWVKETLNITDNPYIRIIAVALGV
ncbi:MAG: hypothetical protein LUD72_14435, partial [Bacteroidales bacterium]|nr:hypothetical protein [Bacteroidales bacterium]